jgi:hypothetical protein
MASSIAAGSQQAHEADVKQTTAELKKKQSIGKCRTLPVHLEADRCL